jgi:hypothetical protein
MGSASLSIILHEYSHFNDFKELNITEDVLCALVLPTQWVNTSYFFNSPAGFYAFKINSSNSSEEIKYQYIDKNTEYTAYIIGSIAFVLFLICYFVIMFRIKGDHEKIQALKQEDLEKGFYIEQLEDYILSHSKDDNTPT